MEIYKSSSAEWPLLQSKTENKFKSGLFNVSAEFIRPVGNSDLPSVIETSIGPVDVWPEPTVSSGTDGFERINATGYGVWNTEVNKSKTLKPVEITATLKLYGSTDPNGGWLGRTHYVFLKSYYGSSVALSYCTTGEPELDAIQFPEGTPYFTPQANTASVFSAFGIELGPLANWYSNPVTKTPASLTPTYSRAWDLFDMQAQKFGNIFEVFLFFGGLFEMNFGPFYSKDASDLLYPSP